MKKISLAVLLGTVAFTVLYYAALFSLPNIIDLNKYKNDVIAKIEEQTGFKVSCENIEFKRSLTPYLKIHMYHTLVLYPDNTEFLKLKDTDLNVKILPLLFKKVVIKNAKFDRPIINLTLYDDFSTSFERYIDTTKNVKTNGFVFNTMVSDTLCNRYKLKINDKTIGKTFYLEGDELFLKDLKLNDKVHFVLKGALYEGKKEYLKYDLDILAPLNAQRKQFVFSPFKTIMESDIKGFVQGQLCVDKNKNLEGVLNIRDLTLKVDDVLLDNNSVKLSFKGEEVEIDALLHTSKKDNSTVKGKFNYGKNKRIDLTTKAKNVDLSNLYKVVKVVCESLNIPNKLKDIKLNGLLDADFSVTSDFKTLKSNGVAKVINAKLSHYALPYAIDNVNANLNLSNNKIIIENAQALVNSTPVKLSGFVNEDVSVELKASSENLDLNKVIKLFGLESKLPINLKTGNLSFESVIKGHIDKNLNAKTQGLVSNFVFNENKYGIPVSIGALNFDVNFDKSSYDANILCSNSKLVYLDKTISFDGLKFNIDRDKIQIPTSKLTIMNSDINWSGTIADYFKTPQYNLSFESEILSSDLASLLKKYINEPYKAEGKIKTKGTITGFLENLKSKVQVKADEKNYLSYLVIKEILNKPSVLNIDVDILDKKLKVNSFSLLEDNDLAKNIFNVSGFIDNKPEFKFNNLKINIPTSLTASTNFLGGEDFSVNGELILNNTIQKPVITGDLNVHYYNLKKYLTSIKNADVSFLPDNIRIIAPDVQINNSKLNVVADVLPQVKDNIIINNLQLNCVNLDFNSLYEVIEKESNPFANSLFVIKKGIATVNNLQILDIKASDISTDILLENNILKLENLNASAYNGQIKGKINYDIPHSQISLMMDGKNVQMKESLYDLCKLDDNIAGVADFSSSLSFTVGDEVNAIKSLTGKVDFHSSNGRMGTLGKFEYYLSAQNILYHGLLNTTLNRIVDALTKDKTAHYRFADGSLLFQNGFMITSSIKTTGKDMSLFVTGRQNMLTNHVNMDIYGRISDEIKSKLGSFGNVSISDFISNQTEKKANNILLVNKNVIDRIPELYNNTDGKSNMFKVNLYGDANSLSVINSFMWVLPKEEYMNEQQEKLPEFSDIIQEL